MSWTYDFAKTYIRCAWANKATALSIAGTAIGMSTAHLPADMDVRRFGLCLCVVSATVFLGTYCGFSTHYAYVKTRNHLRKHGYLDEEFSGKLQTFCGQIGKELALKDAGLEHLIK